MAVWWSAVTFGEGTRIDAHPAAAISNTKPPARETISLGRFPVSVAIRCGM